MPWVRLEDGFTEHPKIVAVGGDAAWLHVCALVYSNRNLTDGCIPKAILTRLSDRYSPNKLAAKLVEHGVWVDDGDCYLIHDYHDYQPTSEQVKENRVHAAERQRKRRAGKGESNGQVTAMSRRDKSVTRP